MPCLKKKYDDSVNIKQRRKPQTQDDTKRNSEMQLRSLKAWEDRKEGKGRSSNARMPDDRFFLNEENCCDDDRKKLSAPERC